MNTAKINNIAVVVAGIDEEYQNNIISGINDFAVKMNVNVSYFAAFGGVLSSSRYDTGEYNIYNLINFSKFDGVILMTNTICAPNEKRKIIENVQNSKIPAVVFDCDEYPEFYNINIDNSKAMQQIIHHVINSHDCKVINFISGPLSNPEACSRYYAFLNVMKENCLPVNENRVFFGEFRGVDGKNAVEKFISSGLELPDAIICANDAMALSAVTTLEGHGISVPDDIIVTGFDNTYSARSFHPALTSVSRPLFDAGYKACEIICQIFEGNPQERDITLEASPVFSESCGCVSSNIDDLKNFKKSSYQLMESCRADISLINRMTSNLAEAENTEESIAVISQLLDEIKSEKCYLCLCSEWQGAFQGALHDSIFDDDDENEHYQVNGYTNKMSAPLVWTADSQKSIDAFNSADMFPEPLTGGGNISYFLPLHFRERCLGYYVIINGDFPIRSMLCHTLMMNISNSIENIRKLFHLNNAIEELNRLFAIDPLCNIYNRNGFIRASDPIFKKCVSRNLKVMIAFIDMDGLKLINDNYGHNEGDFALQRLASVINDCCVKGNICARLGGDEFIILGAGMDENDAELLERRFNTKIAEINKIVNKPYEISASIGTFISSVSLESMLFKLITKADEKMYEQKKRKKNSRYLRRS